jgi:predicted glycoside hydrolase/deacetylase ChbG (UPF0249 family)
LLDGERAFHRTSDEVARFADPEAARCEIDMQIALAQQAGIFATHLDTHMGSVMAGSLYEGFVEAALAAGLAPFALRLEEAAWEKQGYDAESVRVFSENTHKLSKAGVPMLDRICMLKLQDGENDRLQNTIELIDRIKPGQISYLIFHPALDTPELRAICPDWRSRVADYEMLASGQIRGHLEDQGVKLIGCRELQDLLPKAA